MLRLVGLTMRARKRQEKVHDEEDEGEDEKEDGGNDAEEVETPRKIHGHVRACHLGRATYRSGNDIL